MREIVSPLAGLRSPFGVVSAGGLAAPPSFTSQTVYEGQTLLGIDLDSFYTNGATSWAVQSGSLPTGVSISSGQLVGSFTAAGSYSATIRGSGAGDDQDNTFDFTVSAWHTGASAAYDTSDVATSGSNVTAFNDLVGSQDLSLRGSNHATIAGSVVSFTQGDNVAYNATVTGQLGGGNAYAQGLAGTITSGSNANTVPIARSQTGVGAGYARIDLDAGASLQVDPLFRDGAGGGVIRNSDPSETDVLDDTSAELNVTQIATDTGEIWATYQGLPIAYDRRDVTATDLGNAFSDVRFSILGHTATSPNTGWTGTIDGAWEIVDGSSPTPELAARVAGAIGGLSGNFTARPGITVVGIGNSLGAGSSPSAANPETVAADRGFSVLDLSTDNTQYFTADLRAPLSHFRAPDWATATGYSRGDYVLESSQVYYCRQDHTSGTFATDLGNSIWVRAAGREENLSGWTDPGFKGADPDSSSDGHNNIARADSAVYMLNQVVTDSEAFVVYASAHASGACLARETASDNGAIDYWLSASDAGGSGRTSLWDAHLTKMQKVFEAADATPLLHDNFKVLYVSALGGQEARGASNYAGGSNIITTAQYKSYIEAFNTRAFSALGVDMILWERASVDLDYVDNADFGVFADFEAIEEEVAAAEPRFVLGCPGHGDPDGFPDFTVDGSGAWASSVASGGTQIHIGTPGTGDPLHWSAAYHRALGRYNAGLLLAEYRRQRHGA